MLLKCYFVNTLEVERKQYPRDDIKYKLVAASRRNPKLYLLTFKVPLICMVGLCSK